MADQLYDFGMIGLGVMGRNLLLNMADHGFPVCGFDKDPAKVAALEQAATAGSTLKGFDSLAHMVQYLKTPRKLMMLVPAGKPVDDVIEELIPLLQKADIIIDGGNSHYTDTLRRIQYLRDKKLHFMGVGISGGEKGARTGPSIMPGGDPEAYQHVKPLLEAVSAKVKGSPCVAHLGKDAAGHYVKMVHNGIEYSIMQLISEAYLLLRQGLGLSNDELHTIFQDWNEGNLQSFLVEITTGIFLQQDPDTGKPLIDLISDQAGAKGTGMWTSQDAMDLHIPIPVIDEAVSMRDLSSNKALRQQVSERYQGPSLALAATGQAFIQAVQDALYFGTVICYAQGMAMLHKASKTLDMEIPLDEVVRIWRGGCIIRSGLLDVFYPIYRQHPDLENLLLDAAVAAEVQARQVHARMVASSAILSGLPCPGLASSIGYFDALRSASLPTNLIQAQRDCFGSHTYERIDKPGIFHTEWNA